MSSVFKSWLVSRRLTRVVLIAALLPLFGLFSASLVVAIAIVRGWRETLIDCLIALSMLVAFAVATDAGWLQIALTGSATWGLALVIGSVTGLYGSLAFAIQTIIALAWIGLLVFELFVTDSASFWAPFLATLTEQFAAMGVELQNPDGLNALAPAMSGLMATGLVASTIVAALIGCWAAGGVAGQSFRQMFVTLRLGYVIGGLAAVAGLAAVLGLQPLAGNLLLVATVGFVFQGLSVVHWHVGRRGWPGAVLTPLYLLPIMFGAAVMSAVMFGLAMIGFADNWYGLRRADANVV